VPDTKTYVHKIKCMSCSLHFAAFSFYENWKPHHCPECSAELAKGGYMHWLDESEEHVFQFVPGGTPLVEIT
jgi:hypothetical protein